jgi:hypothetical protein
MIVPQNPVGGGAALVRIFAEFRLCRPLALNPFWEEIRGLTAPASRMSAFGLMAPKDSLRAGFRPEAGTRIAGGVSHRKKVEREIKAVGRHKFIRRGPIKGCLQCRILQRFLIQRKPTIAKPLRDQTAFL